MIIEGWVDPFKRLSDQLIDRFIQELEECYEREEVIEMAKSLKGTGGGAETEIPKLLGGKEGKSLSSGPLKSPNKPPEGGATKIEKGGRGGAGTCAEGLDGCRSAAEALNMY